MSRAMVYAAAAVLLSTASAVPASAQVPTAPEVIKLANGSTLMGRIVARDSGRVRLQVDGIGEVIMDSAAITSHGPVPVPVPALKPSPWSGSASVGLALRSSILPGVAETQFGLELKFSVVRALHAGSIMLDGNLGYMRDKPNPATTDEWSLSAGWRHNINGRFVGIGHAQVGANRVQEIQYRINAFTGVGAYVVKLPRMSLLVAPGFGYTKVEQTQRGSVLAFAAGQPSGAAGVVMGVHDMLMVQLAPMVSLEQNALWLHKVGSMRNSQLQFETKLTGMVSAHVGMLIVFNQQYDSSMPDPVRKTVRSLNSGVQVKF